MKLIDSSVEILPQGEGLLGVYQQIERAGRTCYKSEDKITEDSSKTFVDMLINRGHTSPLEHGTIYLKCPFSVYLKYVSNPYSKAEISLGNNGVLPTITWLDDELGELPEEQMSYYVTTNARVLHDNDWMDDLQYLCKPTPYHKHRTTVRFVLSIGIANEFVRHRVFSFCQESSRYCNYCKSKFGNELTFIKPYWYGPEGTTSQMNTFEQAMLSAEKYYMVGIENNLTAQQAREILPKATKTELVMTGFDDDWAKFFDLRCSVAAHPDARKLANELKHIMYDD